MFNSLFYALMKIPGTIIFCCREKHTFKNKLHLSEVYNGNNGIQERLWNTANLYSWNTDYY